MYIGESQDSPPLAALFILHFVCAQALCAFNEHILRMKLITKQKIYAFLFCYLLYLTRIVDAWKKIIQMFVVCSYNKILAL